MVRSLLYLQPVAGDHAALQRYFADQRVLETAARIPGFVAAELHEPIDWGEPALVTALWETAESYQAWLDSPLRSGDAELAKRTFEVVRSEAGEGAVYQLAKRVVRDTAAERSEQS